ncbi:unnamed protein product [Nyctereutes procyonoides]|uniref:(raccoon dog) hypothetical protein n=1 Tax=Nyctereutes procyonoides TaxID=34880 RepID=A0A811YIS8_NYCPR|nr:unnamed protein product [Nyctereutes procyonoides]
MGHMHAPGKGLSQLALLYHCSFPTWLKLMSDDMCLTPSQIDVTLRNSQGVAQVCFVIGNQILRILKSKGLACPCSSRRSLLLD